MPSVLAVEPYPDRAAALRAVAQEPVPDARTLVDSLEEAIAAMERRVPEVILICPLIPPAEEAELIARLRFLPKTLYAQTLITPELASAGAEKPRRILSFRRSTLADADPDAFAKQLTSYISAVREERRHGRSEVHVARAERRAAERTVEEAGAGLHFVNDVDVRNLPVVRSTAKAASTPAAATTALIRRPSAAAIERAPRVSRVDLPWLSTIRLPGGSEADLLNLSSTGMLLETSSKFAPGYAGSVRLCGAEEEVVVPARFVRSEVGAVTTRGVRYRAAVAFDKTIDLEGLRAVPARSETTPAAIADWLRQLSTDIANGGDPQALSCRIRDGLMRMLCARDVEIRCEPVPPPEGCDSIYFTIAHGDGRRAVLQVTFHPGQAPSARDFHILRTASALAAVLFHAG